MEISGPAWRVFCGSIYMISWAVAYMALGGIAYLARHLSWRWLMAILLIPETIYYPLVFL